jgi:hypothetical protein
LAAVVLKFAPPFFIGFPVAGSVAAVDFDLGFLGPAVFLMAVALGCVVTSVPARREGFEFGGEVVVTMIFLPLGRRDSTLHPGPSARQKDRPAELPEK